MVGIAAGIPITVLGALRHNDWGLFAGPALTILGFLVAIPFLVAMIGRNATRMPLTARLAARDTGRHGRRTGAAVAAATVALILPVAVSTATLSSDAKWNSEPGMAADQLLVDLPASPDGFDGAPVQSFFTRLEHEVLPGAIAAPVIQALQPEDPNYPFPNPVFAEGPQVLLNDGGVDTYVSVTEIIYVGGADLLYAVHGETHVDDLEAGYAVAVVDGIVHDGVARVEDPALTEVTSNGMPTRDIRAVDAATGLYNVSNGTVPKLIITPERAEELGYRTEPTSRALVRAAAPITDDQLAAAKAVAADIPGVAVYGLADTRYSSRPLRAAILAFTTAVALAIIAVAIALVSAESRRDRAILAAMGADSAIRRSVAGYRALLMTGLAAWLAIPAGFVPITLIQLASREGYPFAVPWLAFAVVGLLLPVLAGAIGALASRRPPTTQMLRPTM
jgi:putative ABC transport system permease protein